MKLGTMRHLWSEAWSGIARNGLMTVAAVSTVAICLVLSALFLIVVQNMNFIAWVLESEIELIAYLDDDFDRAAGADRILSGMGAIFGVDSVTFVTREEALQSLRTQFGDEEHLLEAVAADNPLRDSIRVSVGDLDRIDYVASSMAALDGVNEVRYEREMIQSLLGFTEAMRLAGMAIVILLGAATFLIVSNTVRLTVFARREEIEIMKLVGATPGFIRLPFIIEGLFVGLAGALVSVGVAWYGYTVLVDRLGASLPFVPLLSVEPVVHRVALYLIPNGAMLGIISATFAVRRFLNLATVSD